MVWINQLNRISRRADGGVSAVDLGAVDITEMDGQDVKMAGFGRQEDWETSAVESCGSLRDSGLPVGS
jgi:hypothetical protein